MSEFVKQLLCVEREVVQLRSEVPELNDTVEKLQDTGRMVRQLTNANNELEGELQDYVVDVDAKKQILADLHAEIEALMQQSKTEISHLQKELFKFRNEVAQNNEKSKFQNVENNVISLWYLLFSFVVLFVITTSRL